MTGWSVSVPGIVSIIAYENQNSTARFGKYYFRVTPSYNLKDGVSISQNISLENYTLLISAGIARYNASVNFQCSGNQFGYLQLVFMDFNGLNYSPVYLGKMKQKFFFFVIFLYYYLETKNKTQMECLTISKTVHFEIRRVQLKVAFVKDKTYIIINNTTVEENYCIADNIEFSIMKEN